MAERGPLPVYSVKGTAVLHGEKRTLYPDIHYPMHWICRKADRYLPPLEYKGRNWTKVVAARPAGMAANIWAGPPRRDHRVGFACPGYYAVVSPIYHGSWITADGVANILTHEIFHVLGLHHCNKNCIMNSYLVTWNFCEEHRDKAKTIAYVYADEGWDPFPIHNFEAIPYYRRIHR